LSAIDEWLRHFEQAIPWAMRVLASELPERYVTEEERAAAAIVVGVQGIVRDLENRALAAERRVEELEEERRVENALTSILNSEE
jgi:hypothetical protein